MEARSPHSAIGSRMAYPILQLLPDKDFAVSVRIMGTLALLAVGILSREALSNLLDGYPFIMFIPTVFVTALLFGATFGVISTLLSVAAAAYFFIAPRFSFAIGWSAFAPVLIFALICIAVCAIVAALRRTVRDLAQAERRNALLYAELHHRTRNDLGLISSTLELRSKASDSEDVRAAYDFAVIQIMAIAASQGRLLDGAQGKVDLPAYMEEICDGFRSVLAGSRPIDIRQDCDPVQVTQNFAVTIGLIVNELVTNALKYAFEASTPGKICVEGRVAENFTICVSDDGAGNNGVSGSGLGTKLLDSLARLYGGSVERTSSPEGYSVQVRLKPPVDAFR